VWCQSVERLSQLAFVCCWFYPSFCPIWVESGRYTQPYQIQRSYIVTRCHCETRVARTTSITTFCPTKFLLCRKEKIGKILVDIGKPCFNRGDKVAHRGWSRSHQSSSLFFFFIFSEIIFCKLVWTLSETNFFDHNTFEPYKNQHISPQHGPPMLKPFYWPLLSPSILKQTFLPTTHCSHAENIWTELFDQNMLNQTFLTTAHSSHSKTNNFDYNYVHPCYIQHFDFFLEVRQGLETTNLLLLLLLFFNACIFRYCLSKPLTSLSCPLDAVFPGLKMRDTFAFDCLFTFKVRPRTGVQPQSLNRLLATANFLSSYTVQ
jgi:hypothetical protein